MKLPSIYFPAFRNHFVFAMAGMWVAWLILFFSYAIRERIRIGHWPYFLDPQTLGASRFPLHDAVVGYGLLIVFFLAIAWSLAVVIQSVTVRPRHPMHGLAALALGWLPLFLAILFAPNGLFEWYFD
jgi:hypothetical protein